jgi:3-phosphoshikimate 1-carboxyvinyltransferase
MIQKFESLKKVNGELNLPGDKSISHRAVMFASMANGESKIYNCSSSEDVSSSIDCFRKLGITIEMNNNYLSVSGNGIFGFSKSIENLYAGNSGTTARLLSGILVPQKFCSVITGDESLSMRPMLRIVEPLKLFGADISASATGTLPIIIKPVQILNPIKHELKVASAQVKSAMILAALHLDSKTEIVETIKTRDHTEKMLGLFTEEFENRTVIKVSKENYPQRFEMTIPSDISTASFFIVLTILLKNSEIKINNISMNITRTGLLKILSEMGANIEIENMILENGELRGNVIVRTSSLKNIEIPTELIPNIIDEIPILSVAGIFAEGSFKITCAKELRVKESDRIKALCFNYKKLGLDVTEFEDGFVLDGSIKNEDTVFESFGDHRIAMAFSVLSMLLKNGGYVNQFDSVGVSNPDFLKQIQSFT